MSRVPFLLLLASLGFQVLAFLPFLAIALRVPLRSVWRHLGDPVATEALRLSLGTSAAATVLCVLLGLPAAYLLARYRFRGHDWLETLSDLPMTVPPVVAGVGLLMAFGRFGLVGRYLEVAGVQVAFTTVAVVLAQTFVAMPFMLKSARAGFEAIESELEQIAYTLGATRWTAFLHVTLPLARPALLAGLTLTWARAMSEFGATLMFAGNLPGRTQTLPLAVMAAMESDPETALSLSLLSVLAAALALLLARRVVTPRE